VRKFFCINTGCKRRIFTERLTNVTAPWARRTLRLAQQLSAIALANGGAAGVRLSEQLGIKVARNTLLGLTQVSHQKSVVGCVRYQESVYLQDLCSLTHPTNVPVA
jgi:hypothetical protein